MTTTPAPADDVSLPELPKPDAIGVWGYMEPTTHSAQQLQAYARAAAIADRARSAGAVPEQSQELARVLAAGASLSNCAFNLAQHPGEPLPSDVAQLLDECRRGWDAACVALRAAPATPAQPELAADEPTYTDDLELRYAEACEERDHLRKALAAQPEQAQAVQVVQLPAAEWAELDYWLGRCHDNGHLDNCADLIEPYEALCKAISALAATTGDKQ